MSLAEAADELGVQPVTLRAAVSRGRLAARKFGNVWVTTGGEVERYRRESLGQAGRPPAVEGPGRPVPGHTTPWSEVKAARRRRAHEEPDPEG